MHPSSLNQKKKNEGAGRKQKKRCAPHRFRVRPHHPPARPTLPFLFRLGLVLYILRRRIVVADRMFWPPIVRLPPSTWRNSLVDDRDLDIAGVPRGARRGFFG